jgi:hypothetical protein
MSPLSANSNTATHLAFASRASFVFLPGADEVDVDRRRPFRRIIGLPGLAPAGPGLQPEHRSGSGLRALAGRYRHASIEKRGPTEWRRPVRTA